MTSLQDGPVIRTFRRPFWPVACIASALLTFLALACENVDEAPIATPDESEVLQLRGFDITAGSFRDAVRILYIERDPSFCASIKDFTPAEALEALDKALGVGQPDNVPIPAATPVSDQARRSREDELKAARITLDECATATVPSST